MEKGFYSLNCLRFRTSSNCNAKIVLGENHILFTGFILQLPHLLLKQNKFLLCIYLS